MQTVFIKEEEGLIKRGRITGIWMAPDGTTRGPVLHANQLTYGCADVLAGLMSGNASYQPSRIGYIYGDTASSTALVAPTNRDQTWANLGNELAAFTPNHANIQVSPFVLPPTLSVDPGAGAYKGNSVTYSSISKSGLGVFPAGTYAGALGTGSYMYHVMLLSLVNGNYIPVARATLANEDGSFPVKPAGFELALFWQVSFF